MGLTGGIASGKSTVSRLLEEFGAQVLDADVLARQVVEPGSPVLSVLEARFPGVVDSEGILNRALLGARVFSDPKARADLNALLHPLIRQAFQERAQALEATGTKVLVYDAALLIENGLHHEMDAVIVVSVPPDVQRERLMARNGLTATEAQARIDAQLPLAKKVPHATWVVDNGGPLEQTREQVRRIWESIQRLP